MLNDACGLPVCYCGKKRRGEKELLEERDKLKERKRGHNTLKQMAWEFYQDCAEEWKIRHEQWDKETREIMEWENDIYKRMLRKSIEAQLEECSDIKKCTDLTCGCSGSKCLRECNQF